MNKYRDDAICLVESRMCDAHSLYEEWCGVSGVNSDPHYFTNVIELAKLLLETEQRLKDNDANK